MAQIQHKPLAPLQRCACTFNPFKRVTVKICIKLCISVPEDCFFYLSKQ